MTTSQVKEKVVCPDNDKCGNPDCMHYLPHEPVTYGLELGQTCQHIESICPLTGKNRRCEV